MQRTQPIFNAPRVVARMIAVLGAVHLIREFLTDEWDEWLVLVLAFIPARYSGEVYPGGGIALVTSFATHMAVHGDWIHLGINCAWLLAFGAIVARRVGDSRFLALSLLTGVAGALLFLAMNQGLMAPMVGVSGAVSGLMGAAMRFMFRPAADESGSPAPLMSFRELTADRRALLAIGVWVGLNLIFGLFLGRFFSTGGIAWEAHLGGFAAGLVLISWLDGGRGEPVATQQEVT